MRARTYFAHLSMSYLTFISSRISLPTSSISLYLLHQYYFTFTVLITEFSIEFSSFWKQIPVISWAVDLLLQPKPSQKEQNNQYFYNACIFSGSVSAIAKNRTVTNVVYCLWLNRSIIIRLNSSFHIQSEKKRYTIGRIDHC